MACRITLSLVGGNPAVYPAGSPLLPDQDDYLADTMVTNWKLRLESVLPNRPDLIVLPECSACFSNPNIISQEEMVRLRPILHRRLLKFLQEVAATHRSYIVYPSITQTDDGFWHNSAIVLDREGAILGQYNKNFTVVTERTTGILCGEDPVLIRCDFGTIALAICFDLNFDEILHVYRTLHPDILIFPSMYHGGVMQEYAAYCCRAHMASCMGKDTIPSEIRAPTGEVLAASTNYCFHVSKEINLDCALVHLDFNREKLAAVKSKYGRAVTIHDPGRLGAVLVSSETEDQTVNAILDEFSIERLDAYLERSRTHRREPANRMNPVKSAPNGTIPAQKTQLP